MNSGDVFAHGDNLNFTRQIDGMTVMKTETGEYYHLSETGAFIWECMSQPTPLAEVKESAATRYSAPLENVEVQIDTFISEMTREGLLKPINLNTYEE